MAVVLDYKKYAQKAREAGTEGIVLLENSNNVLPLVDEEITVFGRTQYDTIYCGTRSGGLVNVPYVISINNVPERTINFVGSEIKQENIRLDLRQNLLNVVDMHFAESGIKINSAELVLLEEKNR